MPWMAGMSKGGRPGNSEGKSRRRPLNRRGPFRRQTGFAVRCLASADEAIEGGSVKGFDFQEFVGDLLKLIAMIAKDLPGFVVGGIEEFFDFRINLFGVLLAAIAIEGAVHQRSKGGSA